MNPKHGHVMKRLLKINQKLNEKTLHLMLQSSAYILVGLIIFISWFLPRDKKEERE